jgi:glycosyltransferase involved in cell wall biosynthesis
LQTAQTNSGTVRPALIRTSTAAKLDSVKKDAPGTLHVLTLTPFYPSAGDEVSGCFVAETLRQLEVCGVRSSVIAVDSIYHPRRKPNHGSPAQWIRYPQLPGNFGLSSAGRFLSMVLLPKVHCLHRLSPIHVIHAHAALPCGHAAAFLAERLGIPFLVTVHGLDVFNRCFERGMAAAWRRKASLSAYRRARKVICISDKIRRSLTDEMGTDVPSEVVYNGADTTLFAPNPGEEPIAAEAATILIVGNLLAGKGHELVLRALATLKDSHPGLQCRMIGEGADRHRFAQLAKDLGIANRVHFLGRRSRSEVADAMRECTVFALPSRYEGLGCVYLEAMACAKPVIACRGQGIDEIICHGRDGWLIPVDGVNELVQAFEILLSDANLRIRIGQAARQTILESLTLSHQVESLRRIYEDAAR